jgi:hypothetical protein
MLRLGPVTGRNGAIHVGPLRIPSERVAAVRRSLPGSLAFLVATIPVLYLLRHFDLLPMWTATLTAGAIGILAQVVVNRRGVWQEEYPTWPWPAQDHAAGASAFASWWVATNALNNLGLEYLVACVAGVAAATAWSLTARAAARPPTAALADVQGGLVGFVAAPAYAEPESAHVSASAAEPTRAPALEARRRRVALPRHVLPALVLVAATVFAFQQTLLFGYRFIGNSDRLNQYLAFILFHTHNLEQGRFAAWSEYMLNGFDILALPFSFFTPLYALPVLLHTDDVVAVFGIVSPALFGITLLEAYFLIYYFTRDRLASLAGACTYGCATYSLLKIAQNDQTYLSILTAPAFFYLVHTTVRRNWLRRYVALTLLATIEFYFAFLQEFSYNVLFLGIYGLYLLLKSRIYPLTVFIVAIGSGALLSLPRLWVQYQTVAASGRGRAVPTVAGDDAVGIRTFLRFLSRDIFGHTWIQNQAMPPVMHINLHEGDLVHSSVFGALLLVMIVLSFRWIFTLRSGGRVRYFNATILILYIFFAFAVMHNTDVYLMLDAVYQNISFQHGRIGVSALLPVALVSALFLAQGRGRLGRRGLAVSAAASAVIIGVSALDFSRVQDWVLLRAGLPSPLFIACNECLPGVNVGTLLAWDALRFAVLAALFLTVVTACRFFGAAGRSVMKTVLAVSIVFQAVWGAYDYLEGPHTRDFLFPYEANEFVLGTSDEFRPPSAVQREQMSTLLDNDHYRSVVICPRAVTQPNCNASLGMSWGIRLVDGYLSGVPQRMASLGWPAAVGGHELRFQQNADLTWTILSFLNARQAIVPSRELYMNAGLELPSGVQLVRNPSPYVYPRAYFGQVTESVTTAQAEAAVRTNLRTCPPACDGVLQARFPVEYVEGPVTGVFDASGDVSLSGGGDRLTLQFPASASQRFLVVNEMWDPGWSAVVDGHDAPVYATNAVMRGVLVPPGATEVVLQYRSLLYWAWWYTPGLMALGGILILLARRFSPRQARLPRVRLPSELTAEPPVPTA